MNYNTYRAVNTPRLLKQSVLYREIIDVRYEIGTKHVKVLCGQEVEDFGVECDEVQSNC